MSCERKRLVQKSIKNVLPAFPSISLNGFGDLHSLGSNITIVTSRRLRRDGHVAGMTGIHNFNLKT
jgi:hypothetical protein